MAPPAVLQARRTQHTIPAHRNTAVDDSLTGSLDSPVKNDVSALCSEEAHLSKSGFPRPSEGFVMSRLRPDVAVSWALWSRSSDDTRPRKRRREAAMSCYMPEFADLGECHDSRLA